MITKPTLILDEGRCKTNIQRMVAKAKRNNCILRPHFKTHQSLEIGQWFRNEGVDRITVSSLSMAAYFSKEWDDITVAFPTNILEIDTINQLAQKIKLSLLVESVETVEALVQQLKNPVALYLKIDTGYHRTGIFHDNYELIDQILTIIDAAPNTKFIGFLTHAGYSYHARSLEEIKGYHEESSTRMVLLSKKYKSHYPNLICSIGDTPTCSVIEDFNWADELRPGNFIFYDLMQEQIGACHQSLISVAVACPVVAVHPSRNEILIYGGAVHFSKEYLESDIYGKYYGHVVENKVSGWGNKIEHAIIKKLSQEHGTIKVPPTIINQFKPGDIVKVLPVHSCLTLNLLKEYQII